MTTAPDAARAPSTDARRFVGWKRVAAGLALAAACFVGFMGVLHTKPGRPMRAWLFGAACPVGNFDASEIEPQFARAAARTRGEGASPRTLQGFTLGVTTRDDVLRWAASRGLTCKRERDDTYVVCPDVVASALPSPSAAEPVELNFLFLRKDATLANFEVYHLQSPPSVLRSSFARVAADWRASLGAPTHDSSGGGPLGPDVTSAALDYQRADATYELTFVDLAGHVTLCERIRRPDLAAVR